MDTIEDLDDDLILDCFFFGENEPYPFIQPPVIKSSKEVVV